MKKEKALTMSWPIGMLIGICVYRILPDGDDKFQMAIIMLLFATGCFTLSLIIYLVINKRNINEKFLLAAAGIQMIACTALTAFYILSI